MLLGVRLNLGNNRDEGLIQEFRPANPVFDGTRQGQVFDVSDELKTYLGSVNDVTVIVNFKPEWSEQFATDAQAGVFLNDDISAATGNPLDVSGSRVKAYCRDGLVAKWLLFQGGYFYANTKNWWGKTISLAYVFSGTSIRMYYNGTVHSIPDGKTTYSRSAGAVRSKMLVPYSGEVVNPDKSKTYLHYVGDMYNVCFYDHAMTADEISKQLAKDEEKFGITFSKD